MYYDFNKTPKEHKAYSLGVVTARILTYGVYKKLKVKGKENVPLKGALIVACNHIAFSDPAVIAAHFPRPVHFMAKSELFEKPLKAAFMRNMNAFPVKRNHFDRSALRRATEILEKGWVLGIFPEGRRVKGSSPTESKGGIGYIAKVTGADVLPVCLYRSPDDDGIRHGLTLSFGRIIKNSELGFVGINKGEEISKASELIMDSIKKLWEAENEGNNRC